MLAEAVLTPPAVIAGVELTVALPRDPEARDDRQAAGAMPAPGAAKRRAHEGARDVRDHPDEPRVRPARRAPLHVHRRPAAPDGARRVQREAAAAQPLRDPPAATGTGAAAGAHRAAAGPAARHGGHGRAPRQVGGGGEGRGGGRVSVGWRERWVAGRGGWFGPDGKVGCRAGGGGWLRKWREAGFLK